MKKVRNIMFGSLAFASVIALFTFARRRKQAEDVIIKKEEEIERSYIDLSEQLKEVKKENEEVKEELEETKEKVKVYA